MFLELFDMFVGDWEIPEIGDVPVFLSFRTV